MVVKRVMFSRRDGTSAGRGRCTCTGTELSCAPVITNVIWHSRSLCPSAATEHLQGVHVVSNAAAARAGERCVLCDGHHADQRGLQRGNFYAGFWSNIAVGVLGLWSLVLLLVPSAEYHWRAVPYV